MRFSKRECVLLTVLAVLLIWSVGRSRILEPAMERRMSAREECSRLERERIEAEQFIDVVIVSEPTLEESGDRFFYETMEDVLPSMRLFIVDENGTQKMLPLDSFTAAAEAGRSASRTGAAQNSSAGVNQQSSVSAENSSASGTGEEVAQ